MCCKSLNDLISALLFVFSTLCRIESLRTPLNFVKKFLKDFNKPSLYSIPTYEYVETIDKNLTIIREINHWAQIPEHLYINSYIFQEVFEDYDLDNSLDYDTKLTYTKSQFFN